MCLKFVHPYDQNRAVTYCPVEYKPVLRYLLDKILNFHFHLDLIHPMYKYEIQEVPKNTNLH